MAIFWCDPYIESPSGGVDGTTGIGTLGSYANPYSIDSIPTFGYTSGDEIRLKALPATPWLTDSLLAWSPSFSIGGSFGVYFASFPDQHSFIKYTSIKGEKTYLSWNTPNKNITNSSPPVWGGMSPYADVTLPAYKLDPQYYLSNLVTPNKWGLLQGQGGVTTTITAGWVSATARGGETIVHRVNPTAVTEKWFGSNATSPITVDAPELTISHSTTSTGRNIQIYGKTVEVHDIIERSGSGSSCSIKIYTGETFKANSLASAGQMDIYGPYYDTPATQGINRDIKHITTALSLGFNKQSNHVDTRLKFKNISCIYLNINNIDVVFSYYNDFFFYARNTTSVIPTEMAIDSAINMATVFEFQGTMSSIAPKLGYIYNNSNYRSYNDTTIRTVGGYLANGAQIDTSRGDAYFRDFLLPTGDTLENTTSHNVKSSSTNNESNTQFKAWGVDRNSGRRVAFGQTAGISDEQMMMYNSTEYNNKLVYHLMPNATYGKCYDRVYIDMPTGVSEIAASTNLRMKYTLGGAVSAGVVVKAHLEGNSSSSSWSATVVSDKLIWPSDGGAGTVIYSSTFTSGTAIVGAQQLVCILELAHQAYIPTGVAKICIDSIELEVV